MGWSTQQLADLAGTTLRAVRHYHEIGLLPEPPRGANGYKDYGVRHLTQLLHIRRLVDFGAPLSEIRTMSLVDHAGAATSEYLDTLRRLDHEAHRAMQRLEGIRDGIRKELDAHEAAARAGHGAPHPPNPDGDFMVVLSRVLRADALDTWNRLLDHAPEDAALSEFSDLDESSTPGTRSDLAVQLASVIQRIYVEHPELIAPALASGRQRPIAGEAIGVALRELYSPAQLDVLARVSTLLKE